MDLRQEVSRAREMAQELLSQLSGIRNMLMLDGEPVSLDQKLETLNKPDGLASATSFGERLRFLRSWKDLTLADLAEKSGMSVNGIGKLEKGETTPRMSTVFKLAKALSVPPAWLEGEPGCSHDEPR